MFFCIFKWGVVQLLWSQKINGIFTEIAKKHVNNIAGDDNAGVFIHEELSMQVTGQHSVTVNDWAQGSGCPSPPARWFHLAFQKKGEIHPPFFFLSSYSSQSQRGLVQNPCRISWLSSRDLGEKGSER